MNPLFQTLIQSAIHTGKKSNPKYPPNRKDLYILKKQFRREVSGVFMILLGVLSAGFGLKGFLLPNGFIDGGVTGISLLVSKITSIPLPWLIVIINLPFIFLGYRHIDRMFALKTLGAIVCLGLCLFFVSYPIITADKLLVSIFGGFFLGAGIGLTMRGGGVIDGTEVLALTISRKTSVSIGDLILIINIIIFSVAAFVLSIETALYSILTYFSASKTLDFIVSGIEEHTGVTIISDYSEALRKMITEKLGTGITIYQGKRGFGNRGHQLNQTDILFTVVTRLEVSKLTSEIEKIDPKAFVIMNSINDTKGGMIKKKPLH
ncbi:MAG: YitT family protein [Bacteroidota bacterium]